MDILNSTPARRDLQSAGRRAWLPALKHALWATRPRRVFVLLIALLALNLFDLAATITAHQLGGFKELNPVACPLLECSQSLTIFKLSLVGVGSLILFLLRRHRLAEMVSWLLCMVYTALAFSWVKYFSLTC